MEQVILFKAEDGSLFDTKEKCEEYEKKSKESIVDRFKKLIVRQAEGIDLTKEGSAFPLATIDECWGYAVIVMRNDDDYETVKEFSKLCKNTSTNKIEKIYDTEIFVGIGDVEGEKFTYNWFYWYCTIDEAIEKYKETLKSFNQ